MATTIKQLGQARPSDTNAVSLYSPGASVQASVRVLVTNTTATDATCRIFVDDDGTTYDQSTAIAYDVTVPANGSYQVGGIYMNNSSGNVAVRSGTASALTFTAFGTEIT